MLCGQVKKELTVAGHTKINGVEYKIYRAMPPARDFLIENNRIFEMVIPELNQKG